jgi:7-cyano-7-deazaguanine synthase
MDSATALFWLAKREKEGLDEIAAVMTFIYGQRGAQFEVDAAKSLVEAASQILGHELHHVILPVNIPGSSALTDTRKSLTHPEMRGSIPATYVPARNLIFFALATALAYDLKAGGICGGWVSVDTDYPDCSAGFLRKAGAVASEATGQQIVAVAPTVMLSKVAVVKLGEQLHVPWELTRSCYDFSTVPCLTCDSCKKRVAAFVKAGVRDPLVDDAAWKSLTKEA